MRGNKGLKNKKGFTLVELVVVIAIIGILGTVMFSVFNSSAPYRDEANGYAKSFYYNAQQVMADNKFSKELSIPTGHIGVLSISATNDGKNWTAYFDTAASLNDIAISNVIGTHTDGALPSGNAGHESTFATLEELLKGVDKNGYYYAVVDDKLRVGGAVWSGYDDWSALKSGDFKSDGGIIGTYPMDNGENGAYLFGIAP